MGPGVGVAIVGHQVWEHAVQDSGILWDTNHPALETEKEKHLCPLYTPFFCPRISSTSTAVARFSSGQISKT